MNVSEQYPGFAADLDLVIVCTGHGRYRLLTDPTAPEYHPGYVEVIRHEAARLRGKRVGPAPRAAKVHYHSLDDAIRAARDCPPCRAAAKAAARARHEGERP